MYRESGTDVTIGLKKYQKYSSDLYQILTVVTHHRPMALILHVYDMDQEVDNANIFLNNRVYLVSK